MKTPRTLTQLRSHPWVKGIDQEDGNGYWLYLNEGYWSPEMETISLHEMTIRELCRKFSGVELGSPDSPGHVASSS